MVSFLHFMCSRSFRKANASASVCSEDDEDILFYFIFASVERVCIYLIIYRACFYLLNVVLTRVTFFVAFEQLVKHTHAVKTTDRCSKKYVQERDQRCYKKKLIYCDASTKTAFLLSSSTQRQSRRRKIIGVREY